VVQGEGTELKFQYCQKNNLFLWKRYEDKEDGTYRKRKMERGGGDTENIFQKDNEVGDRKKLKRKEQDG
jgi:hypothetical protein